jgi:glycosyltransferase involved in cell wall biosynthesis
VAAGKESGPAAAAPPILWHSNAPWAGTGYGTQTALFAPLLQEQLGYRVAFSAFYGLRGSKVGWQSAGGQPYVVYPGGRDTHGNDVLVAHWQDWSKGEPGLVVLLTDPWVMAPEVAAAVPCAAWTPVDHDPLMPRTDEWLKRSGATPIAMSRFGEEMLLDAGHDPLYVPHGFDPDVFQVGDRAAARRVLGLPADAFVVGMVAANKGVPSRKCFAQALEAFAVFQQNTPEAVLYLHTQLEPPDGEDLVALCDTLKIRPRVTSGYQLATGMPSRYVAALMNTFDILLNPSAGEGFGVPLIEAQACVTPCVVTDFSAMPEVAPQSVGNICVGGQRTWTAFESWQLTPDVHEIRQALEDIYYESAKARLARRKSVAKFARENYAAAHVTETYWGPALEEARERRRWAGGRMKQYAR